MVCRTVLLIIVSLTSNLIKWTTKEARDEARLLFSNNNGSKASGAINGTHVEIVKPSENR